MNYSKAIRQLIPPNVLSESHDILGIAIKRDNAAQFAYEPCGAKRNASQMGSNIINNHSGSNRAQNCILHLGFVSALPIRSLTWETEAHPHPLREPGLDLHPDLALYEPLDVIQATGCGLPARRNSLRANPFEDRVQAIEHGITRNQQKQPQN
ncbi:MAG TPA: hypothetical protein VF772_10895 [Terriglobales bacterium]